MDWKTFFKPTEKILDTYCNIIIANHMKNAVDKEHEKLMQEQYAMTHPKCEKETPSEWSGVIRK